MLKKLQRPSNVRNLFMCVPGGEKDGLQLISTSEVAARDDFTAIKNVSREDILAAYRLSPAVAGDDPDDPDEFEWI